MKQRATFRFYPSERQKRHLEREFGCARHVYNWALRLRSDSYKQGKVINYNASSAALTAHRNDPAFAWLRQCSCTPQQQALRHLQTAYSHFFAKIGAYPKFKSKHGPQSVEYTTNAFAWDSANHNLKISKVGHLRVRWSREFASNPTTVTITKDCAGHYFVCLCLDEPDKAPLPKTGESVGIDLGINRFATLSTGERIANPRFTVKHEVMLARAQRILSRKQKGSGRWQRQRLKVARVQAHIADSRKDFLNKLTTGLVRRFDVIAIEDLNVRGMVRNHRLAKHVACASFSQFRRMLEYKTAWYGKELRFADRFFPSSKRCHNCGHIMGRLPLDIREWECPECKQHHDRDDNASHNILAGGHPVKARGERVRLNRASARKSNARRDVNQPALL